MFQRFLCFLSGHLLEFFFCGIGLFFPIFAEMRFVFCILSSCHSLPGTAQSPALLMPLAVRWVFSPTTRQVAGSTYALPSIGPPGKYLQRGQPRDSVFVLPFVCMQVGDSREFMLTTPLPGPVNPFVPCASLSH